MKWYPARSRDGTVVVVSDNGEYDVTDAQGNEVLLVSSEWEPTRVVGLSSDISILFLNQMPKVGSCSPNDQIDVGNQNLQIRETSGWLLMDGYRFVANIDEIDNGSDFAAIRKAVTRAFFDEVLRLLTTQSENVSEEQPMQPGEREVIRQLLRHLDIKSELAFRPLGEFAANGEISSEMIYSSGSAFENFAQGLITPNIIPADLLKGIAVTSIRHIPLDESMRETAHLCWTKESTFYFLLVLNLRKIKRRQGFIFAPDRRSVFGDDFSEKAEAFLQRALISLILAIISSGSRSLRQSSQPPDRGGLLLAGRKALGHGIWEELQAVERALEFKAHWTNLPIFYVHKHGGASLYRPLEHLYPELEGHLIYMDTMQDIVDHAFAHRIQLFRGRGYFARRATRDRLTRVARHHGELHGLGSGTEQILGQRPVLVFGLRLSDRCPIDIMGFYVRLTEALLKRFEKLYLILDGMNVDPDPGGGLATAGLNGKAATHLRQELDLEIDFVSRFRAAVSDFPVHVQSCVGLPIRDNLFWLSQADFFVAPNGGGLAKLRWALDIPGYILTSNVNVKYCGLFNVYADSRYTEEPFAPIYMNLPGEVEDVPIQRSRSERLKLSAIPYPDNFVVNEEVVIPRICDLIQMSLEERGHSSSHSSLHAIQKTYQQFFQERTSAIQKILDARNAAKKTRRDQRRQLAAEDARNTAKKARRDQRRQLAAEDARNAAKKARRDQRRQLAAEDARNEAKKARRDQRRQRTAIRPDLTT